jgi:hypothetical protein
MHARSDIRDTLIELKMRRWLLYASYTDHRWPRWKARKNFWRLLAKYPELAAKLGFNRLTVFKRQ